MIATKRTSGFYVFVNDLTDTEKTWYTPCPRAYPVCLPNFDGFAFFVHRPYIGDGEFSQKEWTLSEATTGALIASYQPTREAAIDAACEKLKAKGIDAATFQAAIDAHINRYGASPYQQHKDKETSC